MNSLNAIAKGLRRWAKALPVPVKRSIRSGLDTVEAIPYWRYGYYCPICETSSRYFGPYGYLQRKNAQCLNCGSLERHRLLWLYLHRQTALFDNRTKKALHIAPEAAFVPRFEKRFGAGYVTADLYAATINVKMDIAEISFADNTFDFILCSHVLEHVPDDRRAMREFHRTLKSDGFAILIVPVRSNAATFEESSIVDPAKRLAAFGQEDHVRVYGSDFVDRLREAGFDIKITISTDFLSNEEIGWMALKRREAIFHCTKA